MTKMKRIPKRHTKPCSGKHEFTEELCPYSSSNIENWLEYCEQLKKTRGHTHLVSCIYCGIINK